MYLNRKHIYEFIERYIGLNKTDMANKMYIDNTNLAPSRAYKIDRMYEAVFKVEDNNIETKIFNSLKYYLKAECHLKDRLIDIWEYDYESFVIELLKRANVNPPPKDQSSSKSRGPNKDRGNTTTPLETTSSNDTEGKILELIEDNTTDRIEDDSPFKQELAATTSPINTDATKIVKDLESPQIPELKKYILDVFVKTAREHCIADYIGRTELELIEEFDCFAGIMKPTIQQYETEIQKTIGTPDEQFFKTIWELTIDIENYNRLVSLVVPMCGSISTITRIPTDELTAFEEILLFTHQRIIDNFKEICISNDITYDDIDPRITHTSTSL